MLYKVVALVGCSTLVSAGSSSTPTGSTCHAIKSAYQSSSCCSSNLAQTTSYDIEATTTKVVLGAHGTGQNVCTGKKPTGPNWDNFNCTLNGVIQAYEQSATNVTLGYVGGRSTTAEPIMTDYMNAGLCPVNVHWHLGTEHYSAGQYDEFGSGPSYTHTSADPYDRRRNLANVRQGFQCHYYNALDPRFTTEYDWKYCTDTHVGETYELHWPHSAAGMCGTPNQYQTPFYDGVFCNSAAVNALLAGQILDGQVNKAVGVQGQVFTVVNDEMYYYPDLIRGWIKEGNYGADIAYYTGSTTGTSRDNTICSKYAPITWQVDRQCHLISASSMDKLCKDMKAQRDDMSGDTHPHGSRTLVDYDMAADNHAYTTG